MIGALQLLLFVLLAFAGMQVVRTRDPVPQTISIGFYGLVLAMLFFLHQAPDVALSQIVVGTVALPLMVLLALAKMARAAQEREAEKKQ
jgi:energy-converting hydrogenase B subunit D